MLILSNISPRFAEPFQKLKRHDSWTAGEVGLCLVLKQRPNFYLWRAPVEWEKETDRIEPATPPPPPVNEETR